MNSYLTPTPHLLIIRVDASAASDADMNSDALASLVLASTQLGEQLFRDDQLTTIDHYPEASVTVFEIKKQPTERIRAALLQEVRGLNHPALIFIGRVQRRKDTGVYQIYTGNLFVCFHQSEAHRIGELEAQFGLRRKYERGEKLTFAAGGFFMELVDRDAKSVFETVEALQQVSYIKYAEPELIVKRKTFRTQANQFYTADGIPDAEGRNISPGVPLHPTSDRHAPSWIALRTRLPQAHAHATGKGIRIAIIDDGIESGHRAFQSQTGRALSKNFLGAKGDSADHQFDDEKHGTAVASIAVSSDPYAPGVAPDAQLVVGRSKGLGSVLEAAAISWAAENADVISCSWGPADGDPFSEDDTPKRHPLPIATRLALQHACTNGRGGKGCLIVFAAGNGNELLDVDEYASNDFVIAVGSTNQRNRRSTYSDYGPKLFCCFPSSDVRVIAGERRTVEGVKVADRKGMKGYVDGSYFHAFGGTSAAAPAVAGIAALVLELAPKLSRDQLKSVLQVSCTVPGLAPGSRTDQLGYGILDAFTAVSLARILGGHLVPEAKLVYQNLLALQPNLVHYSQRESFNKTKNPLTLKRTTLMKDTKAYSIHFGVNTVDPLAYPGYTVPDLRGCVRDAEEWSAFAKTRGYKVSGKFFNEDATRKNFKAQMSAFAKTCVPGDIFLLTFAGHGSQIHTGDPSEIGGFEETWLLHDGILLDDEIDAACGDFVEGVRIVLVADSCHSGTSSRNLVLAKPTLPTPRSFDENTILERRVSEAVARSNYKAKEEEFLQVKKDIANRPNTKAFVKLLAGCQDQETSKEIGGQGVFSSTLIKLLKDPEAAKKLNYQEAVARVRGQIFSRFEQQPTITDTGERSSAFDRQPAFEIQAPEGLLKASFGESTTTLSNGSETSFSESDINNQSTNCQPDNGLLNEPAGGDFELLIGSTDRQLATSLGERGGEGLHQLYDGILPLSRGAGTERLYDQAYDIIFNNPDANIEYVEVDQPLAVDRYQAPRSAQNSCAQQRNPEEPLDFMHCRPTPDLNLTNREVWHLSDEYSQLRKASFLVCPELEFGVVPPWKPGIPHVAMLDTGLLNDYPILPPNLDRVGARSFVRGEKKNKDAQDRSLLPETQGHGTATANLLAGGKMNPNLFGQDVSSSFRGYVGAAPQVKITPVRISDSVVILGAKRFAKGLRYATETLRADVVSMSMAGAPSHRMAAAVNEAYEAGVVVVTAAGNSWTEGGRKLLPEATMYPARFHRVISAVGINANHKPYQVNQEQFEELYISSERSAGGQIMQSCFGPVEVNGTALAAYTPNTLWVGGDQRSSTNSADRDELATMSGGGTSSATPQIAAAAALWLQLHGAAVDRSIVALAAAKGEPVHLHRWRRVEAVRKALFDSARDDFDQEIMRKYFGNGSLQAHEALRYAPYSAQGKTRQSLPKELRDGTTVKPFDIDLLVKADRADLGFTILDDLAKLALSYKNPFKRSVGGHTGGDELSPQMEKALGRTLTAEVYHHLYANENLASYRDAPFTKSGRVQKRLARRLLALEGELSAPLEQVLSLQADPLVSGVGTRGNEVEPPNLVTQLVRPVEDRFGLGILVVSEDVEVQVSNTVDHKEDYSEVEDAFYQEVTMDINPNTSRALYADATVDFIVDPAAGLSAVLVESYDEAGDLLDVHWELPSPREIEAAQGRGAVSTRTKSSSARRFGGQQISLPIRLDGAPGERGAGKKVARFIGRIFSLGGNKKKKIKDNKIGKEIAGRYLNLLVDVDATNPEKRFSKQVSTRQLGRALEGGGPLLLMLHGTLNNARGSFKDLAPRDNFWEAARKKYGNRMVAFEMPTILHSVERNTKELLKLTRAFGDREIDILSTSRGGLVARDFVLQSDLKIGKMAMLAGTHYGTPMAELDNLSKMINQTTRLIKFAGGPIGGVFSGIIGAINSFLTFAMNLPGLEAQDPDNDYLKRLNTNWDFGNPNHLYISANFEPTGRLKRVLNKSKDGLVFRGAENDGIAPTAGALGIGPDARRIGVSRRIKFDAVAGINHPSYFKNEEVAREVMDWLEIGPSQVIADRIEGGRLIV